MIHCLRDRNQIFCIIQLFFWFSAIQGYIFAWASLSVSSAKEFPLFMIFRDWPPCLCVFWPFASIFFPP